MSTQTPRNIKKFLGIPTTARAADIRSTGTVTANGSTAVAVSDTKITANSTVIFTLKTVGGTPAGAPYLSAVTAGSGFSVKAAVGDTSVYNYQIIE